VSRDARRPALHALLELQALLGQLAMLRREGDAARFAAEPRYRWLLHRLWIAAGNEALAYTRPRASPCAPTEPGPTCTTYGTISLTPAYPILTKGLFSASPGRDSIPCRASSASFCWPSRGFRSFEQPRVIAVRPESRQYA